MGVHADGEQDHRRRGCDTDNKAGTHALQDGGPDKAAYHEPAPVHGEEIGGGLLGQTGYVRKAHIADRERADGDLGTHVGEDAESGEQ